MSRVFSRYGSLSQDRLAAIVRGICLGGKSGVLHLFNKEMSKRLYFNRGSIVFAGSDVDEDRLGEVLIREEKIKRSDLDLAWQVMKRTGQSLSEFLIEMGFLTAEDIRTQSVRRMKAIVHSAFTWTSGKYRFEEMENPVDKDVAMDLPPTVAILEGIRRIQDPAIIRNLLGDLKRVIRRPDTVTLPYDDEKDFTPQELVVMDLGRVCMDGVSTAADLVAMSPLGENETLQCICSLVSVGALELEEPAAVPAAERSAGPEETTPGSGTTPASEKGAAKSSMSLLRFGASSLPERLGRYEIQDLLGRGSMGTVFLARDPVIDRVVAIKLIQNATFFTAHDRERYRNRFRREAKAAGKLIHPGIVTVFDFGYADEESPFIVMEYVQGPTLQELLQQTTLSLDETMQIAHEVLDALSYAHSFGIVHRDIKPANVLVTPGPHAKVMDFGIAHVIGSRMTATDQALGSPNYMAPEQLSKGKIDPRTDLFAFGVVLYRLLTGKLPFTGDSFAASAQAILGEQPVPPESLNPAVSPALAQIVLRCLNKDPEERFASAEAMKVALTSLAIDDHLGSDPHDEPARESVAFPSTKADLRDVTGERDSQTAPFPGPEPEKVALRPVRGRRLRAALAMSFVLGAGLTFLVLLSPRENSRGKASPEQASATPASGWAQAPHEDGGPAGGGHFSVVPDRVDAAQPLESEDPAEPETLGPDSAPVKNPMESHPGVAGPGQIHREGGDARRSETQNSSDQDSGDRGTARQPAALSEPQLFYEARMALERGELQRSQARVEELLRRDPSFAGASELLVEVTDEIWKHTLPLSFEARHRHRLGGCTGRLRLAVGSIRYFSEDHEWTWPFGEIRVLERTDREELTIETYERDILGMGKPKRYRFTLSQPLGEEMWNRYQRVVQRPAL